jgi:hypothetical protein
MTEVEQILKFFEEERVLKLTVVRHNAAIPIRLNDGVTYIIVVRHKLSFQ